MRSILFCILQCVLLLPAHAQDSSPGRIPTVTRLVKIVGGLEEQLATGVRKGDRALVEQMLTEDFEARISAAPGTPVPRAEWMREVMASPETSSQFTQMAVHEHGDVAVASFQLARTHAAGRKGEDHAFVVDVWQRSGDSWKLATRYASPTGAQDSVVAGVAVPRPATPKRY